MKPNYSETEVRALVENYAAYKEKKSTHGVGLHFLCRLADLDRAVKLLQPKEYQAILLHGMLRVQEAESLLGVSRRTMYYWYESGISWIVRILNEGVVA